MTVRSPIPLLTAALTLSLSFPTCARGFQTREHLTPQEIELVKDAQELDLRVEVFIKAADRRLSVITGVAAPITKQSRKDNESWGTTPSGTRAELIGDIAGILDEAITNIDDVSARDERNPLLPKALRKLAAAASRIVAQLKDLESQAKSDAEVSSFLQLTENAESIIQAANKLPPVVEKKAKGKTEKTKGTN
jgi:hypothetical protein